jgi:hypothetical protein
VPRRVVGRVSKASSAAQHHRESSGGDERVNLRPLPFEKALHVRPAVKPDKSASEARKDDDDG